jgi:Family of unknown function (DUF5681)
MNRADQRAGARARRLLPLQPRRKPTMQFQKGQSGNPAGRPRGSRNKTTVLMQNLLEGEAEAIARKAIEMAKDGDMAAIRVCMDRLAAIRRKGPIAFELPPVHKARDTVAAVTTVISALAAGDLTTSEAADLTKIIDCYLRTISAADFEQRLERLERESVGLAPRPEPTFDAPTAFDGHAMATAEG